MEATMDNDNIHSAYRGDIFSGCWNRYAALEQGGVRPVLIIQNDIGNRHSPSHRGGDYQPHKASPITDPCKPEWAQCGLHNESTINAGTASDIRQAARLGMREL